MANNLDKEWAEQKAARAVPAPTFAPSKYQADIFRWISDSTGHAVVEATAGSGKTTTTLEALKLMGRGRVLFCAFGNRIAQELRSRAPAHVEVSTIHSMGFSAVRKALGKVTLENTKLKGIAAEVFGKESSYSMRQAAIRLADLCRMTLTDTVDCEAMTELAERHDIELGDEGEDITEKDFLFGVCEMVENSSIQAEEHGVIDFADMIYLPSALGLNPASYDWVCVDEAQDLNRAQRSLVLKGVRNGGRVLAVGDRNQSIFGFSGADTEAIPALITDLKATTLPLSICYRCPTRHLDLARELVPSIEARPGAPLGKIDQTNLLAATRSMTDEDLVICRINAPLATIAMRLIRAGKKCQIMGRDIGKGLQALVTKQRGVKSLADLVRKLTEYRAREVKKLEEAGKSSAAASIADRVETIIALTDGIDSVRGLEHRIESIFSDEKAGVTLSSVHKAKGLEARRVYIYDRSLMPFPKAKKEWEQVQERNLEFVALTRAKEELIFIDKEVRNQF